MIPALEEEAEVVNHGVCDSKDSNNTENEFVLVSNDDQPMIYNMCVTTPIRPAVEEEDPLSDESGMSTECSMEVPCSEEVPTSEEPAPEEQVADSHMVPDDTTTSNCGKKNIMEKAVDCAKKTLLLERKMCLNALHKDVINRQQITEWYIKRRNRFLKLVKFSMENLAMALVFLEVNFLAWDEDSEDDENEEEIGASQEKEEKEVAEKTASRRRQRSQRSSFQEGLLVAVVVPLMGLGLLGCALYVVYLKNHIALLRSVSQNAKVVSNFQVDKLRREIAVLRRNSTGGVSLPRDVTFNNKTAKSVGKRRLRSVGKHSTYNEVPNQTGSSYKGDVRSTQTVDLSYLITPRFIPVAPVPKIEVRKYFNETLFDEASVWPWYGGRIATKQAPPVKTSTISRLNRSLVPLNGATRDIRRNTLRRNSVAPVVHGLHNMGMGMLQQFSIVDIYKNSCKGPEVRQNEVSLYFGGEHTWDHDSCGLKEQIAVGAHYDEDDWWGNFSKPWWAHESVENVLRGKNSTKVVESVRKVSSTRGSNQKLWYELEFDDFIKMRSTRVSRGSRALASPWSDWSDLDFSNKTTLPRVNGNRPPVSRSRQRKAKKVNVHKSAQRCEREAWIDYEDINELDRWVNSTEYLTSFKE